MDTSLYGWTRKLHYLASGLLLREPELNWVADDIVACTDQNVVRLDVGVDNSTPGIPRGLNYPTIRYLGSGHRSNYSAGLG